MKEAKLYPYQKHLMTMIEHWSEGDRLIMFPKGRRNEPVTINFKPSIKASSPSMGCVVLEDQDKVTIRIDSPGGTVKAFRQTGKTESTFQQWLWSQGYITAFELERIQEHRHAYRQVELKKVVMEKLENSPYVPMPVTKERLKGEQTFMGECFYND